MRTRIRGGPRGRLTTGWLIALLAFAGLMACDKETASTAIEEEPDDNPNNDPNNDTGECGDGVCDSGEQDSCPDDCDPPAPECGNGTCEEGESNANCPQDCTPTEGDCSACAADQICVDNEAVTNVCFDRDCPGERCDGDEVCFNGECASEPCAGLDCGGYPNVCRGGICLVGSCNDPDVRCPDGQECVNDLCLSPCDTQADCGDLACINDFCSTCDVAEDCGGGLVCVGDQCVPPCTEDPDRCNGDEVCVPETGLCGEPCTPGACAPGQVCDGIIGLCVDGECGEGGVNDCPEGEVCREHFCVPSDPPNVMGMSAGNQQRMESPGYKATMVLSPMDMIGNTASSPNFTLQSGTLSIQQGGQP